MCDRQTKWSGTSLFFVPKKEGLGLAKAVPGTISSTYSTAQRKWTAEEVDPAVAAA